MEFEKFSETGEPGKYVSHHDGVERTTASQGSRRDANPSNGVRFGSFEEERHHLFVRLKEIDVQLTGYSKGAMLKRQQEVRRQGGNTFAAWIQEKARLESERARLVKGKAEIEKRLSEIRGRLRAERRLDHDEYMRNRSKKSDWVSPLAERIIALLEDNRDLLEESFSVLVDIRDALRQGSIGIEDAESPPIQTPEEEMNHG